MAVLLTAAVAICGGASRENPIRLAAVELLALPVAAVAVRRLATGEARRPPTATLILLGLILILPILQLVPLPPAIWTVLPGQAPRLDALGLAHLRTPWLPMSLAPAQTAAMALALIPPVAMFLASLSLDRPRARRLVILWLALAVLGLALGLAQVASPGGGLAYPYRTTNLGSLVGLFANRNHEAGFLLALAPLAAALATPPTGRGPRPHPTERPGGVEPRLWLLGAFIGLSVVALGVIRSRAGVILAGPAILAALAVIWRGSRGRLRWGSAVGFALVAALAAIAVAVFGLTPILDRFGPRTSGEMRFEAWPYVAAAAERFLPLGAGLGSFDRVFQSVEPLGLVSVTYFNHAHNDYLELWLEAGWLGAAILALFLLWLIARALSAWREGSGLARAASAAIMLILAESAVDYPLRTETMMVLFAFCCALLAAPRREGQREVPP